MRKVSPLKASFMFISMVGFLISVVYVSEYSLDWAFAFGLVFVLMFIASVISMQRGNPDAQLYPIPKK
ncbi:hypothetical protein KY329_04725 [Candidatus Woesearchaeota archaeon]|nr:hypothetical protein [Candidatus Woesearchaeota archaeon]